MLLPDRPVSWLLCALLISSVLTTIFVRAVVVAVVGPPASGKTTLAHDLATHLDYPVLRIANLLEIAAHHNPSIAVLAAASRDLLGWVSDAAVSASLDVCFRQRHAIGRAVSCQRGVVLDNFPGRASQTCLVAGLTQDSSSALYRHTVCSVVLDIEDTTARLRAKARTVCTPCGYPTTGDACPVCSGATKPRSDDLPTFFEQRLSRYRSQQLGVITGLREMGPQVRFNVPHEQSGGLLADSLLHLTAEDSSNE